jgi:hypothetical protein
MGSCTRVDCTLRTICDYGEGEELLKAPHTQFQVCRMWGALTIIILSAGILAQPHISVSGMFAIFCASRRLVWAFLLR